MTAKINDSELRFAALAVDAVCFRMNNAELEVLLGKVVTVSKYNGYWAHIGGLIRVDETAEEAVDRLLRDKAGIKDIHKEQLYTFSDIDRDPRGRVVSVAYLALTTKDESEETKKTGVETKWVPVKNLKGLAYDHDNITKVAVERLRSKIIYTDIAKHLMPKEFTLSDLQRVYEAVLGEAMDKRNFRKRVLSLGNLRDTRRTIKRGVMRPAALYSFKS